MSQKTKKIRIFIIIINNPTTIQYSTRLMYSTSTFSIDVENLVLSLPRQSYPFMEMGRRDKSRGGNSTSSSSPRFYDIASDNDISDNDRKFVGGGR